MIRRAIPFLALTALVAAACTDNSDPVGIEESAIVAGSETTADSRWGLQANSQSGDAMVYVVHGISGTDLGAAEALPVDVFVSGVGCALQGFEFRDIEGPLALPAGSYDIEVRLTDGPNPCEGTVAISAPSVMLEAGKNVSIVAHLAENTTPTPTASVFANNVTRVPGRARIAAHHAANFGAVDVLVDGAVAFAGVTNGQQGVAMLRPGEHDVAIAVAGTDTKAFEETLVLRPFTLYNAYAVGTPGNGTFEVLLQRIPIRQSNAR